MSLTVYKSSAGSGKTFTLVKAYLKIALKYANGSGIKNILAMTFTNKAANEMQTRIVEQLNSISKAQEKDEIAMLDVLLEDPELSLSREEIIKRSGKLLHQILHHYSYFSIATIDKFNHQVIRTFSNELGLSQNFEVELEQEEVLKEAIERLIGRAGQDKVLTNFLIQFSLDRIEVDQSWRVEQELFDHAKIILSEDAEDYLHPLAKLSLEELSGIRTKIKSEVSAWEQTMKQLATGGMDILQQNQINPGDLHYGNRGGLPSYFKKIAQGKLTENPSSRVLETIEQNKWYSASKPVAVRSAIESVKDQLTDVYRQIESELAQQISSYVVKKAVLKNFYGTALINEVYREFEALKSEKNILPISDFNKLISRVVSEQEAPFIYERLGNHFGHYLIDEFQDTSQMQWKNLLPLVENSLSLGKENLIVGDAKQAIYRWRGGDVYQFVNVPAVRGMESSEVLQQRVQFMKQFIKETQLDTNYRSLERVVSFNNAVFGKIAGSIGAYVEQIYREVDQKFLPANSGGLVEVRVYDDHRDNEESFDQYNIRETIACINNLREQGYAFGDIAILGRSNANLVKLVEAFEESDHDIPTISSEALLLFHSKKVRLLHSFLKLMLNPHDHHEQLRLLYLIEIIHGLKQNLYSVSASIVEQKNWDNFDLIMRSFGYELPMGDQREIDAYEMLELGISSLNLGDVADAYLASYTDFAFAYFKKHGTNLLQFLHHAEERKDRLSLSTEGRGDAIQLLTIHKSKGLEFPVVIYPFADFSFRYFGKSWFNVSQDIPELPSFLLNKGKDLELTRFKSDLEEDRNQILLDELNVFYVACTRAVEQLHLFTSNSKKKDMNKHLLPALQEIKGWENDFHFLWGSPVQKVSNEKNEKGILTGELQELESMHSYPEKDRFNYIYPSYSKNQNSMNYGNHFHELTARIQHQADVMQMVTSWSLKHGLDEAIQSRLTMDLNKMYAQGKMAPLLASKNYQTEVEFTDGQQVFRVDRLLQHEGQWYILDFKTGTPQAEDIEQLTGYKALVSEAKNQAVKGLIYYTETGETLEV